MALSCRSSRIAAGVLLLVSITGCHAVHPRNHSVPQASAVAPPDASPPRIGPNDTTQPAQAILAHTPAQPDPAPDPDPALVRTMASEPQTPSAPPHRSQTPMLDAIARKMAETQTAATAPSPTATTPAPGITRPAAATDAPPPPTPPPAQPQGVGRMASVIRPASLASERPVLDPPSPPPAATLIEPPHPALTPNPEPPAALPQPSPADPVSLPPTQPVPTRPNTLSILGFPLARRQPQTRPAPSQPDLPSLAPPAAANPASIAPSGAESDSPPIPFRLQEFTLCKSIAGFGQYERWNGNQVETGRHVLLYVELLGLASQPRGVLRCSRVAATIELWPRSGQAPVWSCALGEAEDIAPNPAENAFAAYRIRIPQIPPGEYDLRLIQSDLLASQVAQADLHLSIDAPSP